MPDELKFQKIKEILAEKKKPVQTIKVVEKPILVDFE